MLVFYSCGGKNTNSIDNMVSEWVGKEIKFPLSTPFIDFGEKNSVTFEETDYRIVSYVDPDGCLSCKLQLPHWKRFISEVDSVNSGRKIPFLFYFYPKSKKELYLLFEQYNFTYPIYIDEDDSLNKLNHFPMDIMYQTFLLDTNNKVLIIGNPTLNPKIKELYLKKIQDKNFEFINEKKTVQTQIEIFNTVRLFGCFDWQKEQKATFVLKNIGDKPLVIEDVNTSCGCTSVDYSKEPVRPGGEIRLEVLYKADHPEHFNKTITVYCNSESSPIKLTISGNAQ